MKFIMCLLTCMLMGCTVTVTVTPATGVYSPYNTVQPTTTGGMWDSVEYARRERMRLTPGQFAYIP